MGIPPLSQATLICKGELLNKEVKHICRTLERAGWVIVKTKDHFKAKAPDSKTIIIIPLSPSDHRWKANLISQIRRSYGKVPNL